MIGKCVNLDDNGCKLVDELENHILVDLINDSVICEKYQTDQRRDNIANAITSYMDNDISFEEMMDKSMKIVG